MNKLDGANLPRGQVGGRMTLVVRSGHAEHTAMVIWDLLWKETHPPLNKYMNKNHITAYDHQSG